MTSRCGLCATVFAFATMQASAAPIQMDLRWPAGIELIDDTTLLVPDRSGHRLWRVDLTDHTATRLAGTGERGFSGDGGPAHQAQLFAPETVAVAPNGDILIADRANARVRRIDAESGAIETIAGDGQRGFAGDGGPAHLARISNPYGLDVAPNGDVYFADTENQRIRRIDRRTGVITSVAGDGERGFRGDGENALAASFSRPHPVLVTEHGLIIADSFNHRLRMLDLESGIVMTIAGTGERALAGDGGDAIDASFFYFGDLAIDPQGRLVMTGWASNDIRRIDFTTGRIEHIAGARDEHAPDHDGLHARDTRIDDPHGLAIDSAGNIYYAEASSRRVRRIDARTGVVTTVIESTFQPE